MNGVQRRCRINMILTPTAREHKPISWAVAIGADDKVAKLKREAAPLLDKVKHHMQRFIQRGREIYDNASQKVRRRAIQDSDKAAVLTKDEPLKAMLIVGVAGDTADGSCPELKMAIDFPKSSTSMRSVWSFFLAALLVLGAFTWFNDSITLEGEWTLYTARCDGGGWQEGNCTGRLVAADRYRFVANKTKHEVNFEVVGGDALSGKMSNCAIADGRDWTCSAVPFGAQPATQGLVHSRPLAPDVFHGDARVVPKWKWIFLRLRIPVGHQV